VCLSFSAHHPELWQPAWGIRLILEAIISFLPTPADGAIGALDWTKEERAKLAKESVKFHCPVCCAVGQYCADLLPEVKPAAETSDDGDGNNNNNKKKKKSKFQEEIEKLKMLQGMHHAKEEEEEEKVAENSESKEEAKETEQADSNTDETSQLLPSVSEDRTEVISNTSAPKSQEAKLKPEQANDDAKPPPLPDQNTPEQSSSSEPSDVNQTSEQAASNNAADSPPTTQHDVTGDTSAGNQTNTTAAPPAMENQTNIPAASPQHSILVTEPFLNGMILAFSVTVMYLLTQAKSLLEELQELQS